MSEVRTSSQHGGGGGGFRVRMSDVKMSRQGCGGRWGKGGGDWVWPVPCADTLRAFMNIQGRPHTMTRAMPVVQPQAPQGGPG